MRFSTLAYAASMAAFVSAHGCVTEIRGANGVIMPGLSVREGTPRDCTTRRCGAQDDTMIIKEEELGNLQPQGRRAKPASALGRTLGGGPVDAAAAVAKFMGSAANAGGQQQLQGGNNGGFQNGNNNQQQQQGNNGNNQFQNGNQQQQGNNGNNQFQNGNNQNGNNQQQQGNNQQQQGNNQQQQGNNQQQQNGNNQQFQNGNNQQQQTGNNQNGNNNNQQQQQQGNNQFQNGNQQLQGNNNKINKRSPIPQRRNRNRPANALPENNAPAPSMAGQGATSGMPTCADDGTVTMVYHQVNGDGAGPLTATLDATSGGTDKNAFVPATITQNVDGRRGNSRNTKTDFLVTAQMPAGTVCTGQCGPVSNCCIMRLQNPNQNAGPFGGAVAFVQSAGNRKRALEYLRKRSLSIRAVSDDEPLDSDCDKDEDEEED